MYGQTARGAAKYYRKPGLPGATTKPMAVRSLIRQSTSLEGIPKSQTLNRAQDKSLPDLTIFTPRSSGQHPGPLQSNVAPNRSAGGKQEDVSNRRPVFSSASSWRSRNHTTLGIQQTIESPASATSKPVQFHLNGVGPSGSSSQTHPSLNTSLGAQGGILPTKGKAMTGKMSKTVNKTRSVHFTDIQREAELRKTSVGAVGLETKNVKKYR